MSQRQESRSTTGGPARLQAIQAEPLESSYLVSVLSHTADGMVAIDTEGCILGRGIPAEDAPLCVDGDHPISSVREDRDQIAGLQRLGVDRLQTCRAAGRTTRLLPLTHVIHPLSRPSSSCLSDSSVSRRSDFRIASIPPALRIRRIDSGRGSPCRTVPASLLRTSPVARSTSMSHPGENALEAPGHGSTGRPMATALRRKSRAKESATTQATPSSNRFSGAVSRLEPQPKSRPATTTSPACTSAAKLGLTDSSVCILRTSRESTAYCPGESRSVLIPSPKHQVLPLMAGCVDNVFLSRSALWRCRWRILPGELSGVCDVTRHRRGRHRLG